MFWQSGQISKQVVRILFWTHLIQASIGVVSFIYYFPVLRLIGKDWELISSLVVPLAGWMGCWRLHCHSASSYSLFVGFNLSQLFWVTSESFRYVLTFGFRINIGLASGSTSISLNLVALALLVLTVMTWERPWETRPDE
jgi:hypothetical protein